MRPNRGGRRLIQFDEVAMRQVSADLTAGFRVTIQAAGWSMLPLLWDRRDKLTLAPLSEGSIAPGRIVLVCIPPEQYIIHRIATIDGERLTLRGDGNPYQTEQCLREHVRGELVAIEREGKVYVRDSELWQRIDRFWPSAPLLRRALLALYKRIFITKTWRLTPEVKRKYRL